MEVQRGIIPDNFEKTIVSDRLQINSSIKSQFQLQDYPTYLISECASPRTVLSISVDLGNVDTDLTSGMEK